MKVPGDFVAANEEFVAGKGVFEADDGIYAAVVGEPSENQATRSVSVKPAHAVRPLKAGDLVYALIEDVYDSVSLTSFQPVEPGVASSSKFAYLRISELTHGYADKFGDYLRIGDYLKARVVEITPLGIYLTIVDEDLGVIRAFCAECHHAMKLEGESFKCTDCGSVQKRKYPGGAPISSQRPSGGFGRGGTGGRPSFGGNRGGRDRGPPRGGGFGSRGPSRERSGGFGDRRGGRRPMRSR